MTARYIDQITTVDRDAATIIFDNGVRGDWNLKVAVAPRIDSGTLEAYMETNGDPIRILDETVPSVASDLKMSEDDLYEMLRKAGVDL